MALCFPDLKAEASREILMQNAPIRSDSEIRQDILDELDWDPSIHSDDLDVSVKKGTATMTGDVGSCFERWSAERVIRSVSGVKGLIDKAHVRLEGEFKRDDVEIMTAIQSFLEWTASLSTDCIGVLVKDGQVTLIGTVPWQFQRAAVVNAVRNLKGVTGINDEIIISPLVTLQAVKADIEAALRRSAATDARHISVGVNGSEVTLAGNVSSWAEQCAAASAAWNSPGVTNVVDKLTVVH